MKVLKIAFIIEVIAILLLVLLFHRGVGSASRIEAYNFDGNCCNWITPDKSVAEVSLENGRDYVHSGGGSLKFEYHWEEGKLPVCASGNISLEGKEGVRFWIKSGIATVGAIIVRERDGSSYMYPVAIGEAEKWKEISFNLSDMKLTEDSKDENNKLDKGDINIGFVDILAIFSKASAERIVHIDEMSFLNEPVAALVNPNYADFETDTGGWVMTCPSSSSLKVTRDKGCVSEGKGALQFDYTISPTEIIGLLCFGIKFEEESRVEFWIKTEEISEIVVGVEERDKSRYTCSFETEGGKGQKVSIPLSHFSLAEDSDDENGTMDAGQLNGCLFIADLDNFLGLKTGNQKLWIDEFEVGRE